MGVTDQQKILITGTSGFLGGVLKQYFRELGWDVYGTVRSRVAEDDHEALFDVISDDPSKALWNYDFDTIVHTIACLDHLKPKEFIFDVNLGGTEKMLDYAKSHNCRHFIQLSSIEIYGIPIGENKTEQNTKRHTKGIGGPYSNSKALAEVAVENSGVNYTTLRLPIMIGKGDSYTAPMFIRKIREDDIVTASEKNHFVSVMNAKNLGPLISKILDKGPLNSSYNAVADDVPWKDFVYEHSKVLKTPVKAKKKAFLTIIPKWNDKDYAYLMYFSRFGAQFPSEKLKSVLGDIELPHTWQDAVREGIEGSLTKNENIFVPKN